MARRGARRDGWSSSAHEIVDRVFVYGTLRAGQTARRLLAEHLAGSEPATIEGAIYALPEGYPILVTNTPGTVVGELVTLRDLASAFPLLDAYEGDEYDRILTRARTADGNDCWCWVYACRNPVSAERGEHIASGDWSTYRNDD